MFAPGPRAVGFTIVWPEGVIFRSMMTYHAQFLLLVVAGWVNRQQQDVIDYQQEENRVLRAGLRGKRLKLSDDDRRRLAVKAQALGREALAQIASVATPATLLRWYRCLIAAKYDGSKNRSPGRPADGGRTVTPGFPEFARGCVACGSLRRPSWRQRVPRKCCK